MHRSLDKGNCEITSDVLMFFQGCVDQSFFDMIGKDGFDIRDLTPQQVEDEIISKLPEGWVCTYNDEEEEAEEVRRSWFADLTLLSNFSHLIYSLQ